MLEPRAWDPSKPVLGWRELQGWRDAMTRQIQSGQASPDSWDNSENDENWRQLRREREKSRGR